MKLNYFFAASILLIVGVSPNISMASNSSRISDLEARIERLEQRNKNFYLKVNIPYNIFGTIQYDKTFVTNNNDLSLQNNSKLRRARLGIKGNLSSGYSYKFEVDFADNGSTITDAYIKKTLNENTILKIGQYREPFSLDELTSVKHVVFLERASIIGLTPARNIGIGYEQHLKNFNVYTGIFGDGVGDSSTTDDETISSTTRVTYYQKSSKKNALHLGVSYRYSEPTADNISYIFKPESSIETSSSAINTGTISNANKIYQTGLEAAIVHKQFSAQAEYINTEIDRDSDNINNVLEGYYFQFSYFLTDDMRNYKTKSSVFGRIKPTSKTGAWEIAYRYSDIEANSGSLTAGNMENNTIGINYYASDRVKFMANYIDVNVDKNTVYSDDVETFALRAQINF